MKGRTAGVSLLELLLVLALTAILIVGGVANWRYHLLAQQKRIAIAQLSQALAFAKQAALLHHQQVTLCAAATDSQCGDNWAQGILIYLDSDGQSRPESNNLLLRVPEFAKSGAIIWKGWLGHQVVRFAADGEPHSFHGTFYWRQADKKEQALVIINAMGRIRQSDDSEI